MIYSPILQSDCSELTSYINPGYVATFYLDDLYPFTVERMGKGHWTKRVVSVLRLNTWDGIVRKN